MASPRPWADSFKSLVSPLSALSSASLISLLSITLISYFIMAVAAKNRLTKRRDSKKSANTTVTPPADMDRTGEFQGEVAVDDRAPTAAELDEVAEHLVLDASGASRPFKSLHSAPGGARRVLVIFIRHFFCGMCQEFVRALTESITPEALLSLPEPTFITVVGCGRPDLIPMYMEVTKCPFPIYTDPTYKLYDTLGMTRTLNMGSKKPVYIRHSLIESVVGGIVQSLKAGNGALKGGDWRQIGGEFLFEDGQVSWCHRMRNTRDHAELPEIRRVLGFEDGVDGVKGSDEEQAEAAAVTPVAAKRRSLVASAINRMSGDWGRRGSATEGGFLARAGSRRGKSMDMNGAKTNGRAEGGTSVNGRAEGGRSVNGGAQPQSIKHVHEGGEADHPAVSAVQV